MSILDSIWGTLTPVHRDGWRFVAIGAVIAVALFWLDLEFLAWIALLLTLWCAYFFRDPERVTPIRDGLVIAPADGRISAVEMVAPPAELDLGPEPASRVSIFMNVFDVHINRAPCDARIARLAYVPGAFLNAELDKASSDNERQALTLELKDGSRIGIVQIAGLIARRIVSFAAEGDLLHAGQRFGLIRFGSRVDVFLPKGVAALVAPGQRAIAGETVIADLASAEPGRVARRS